MTGYYSVHTSPDALRDVEAHILSIKRRRPQFKWTLSRRARTRESAAAIPMISLAFLTTWGQSGASGCRTINHWRLGARKPYGARLFGVFALVGSAAFR